MYKALCFLCAVLFLISCAERPGGVIVVNEETIENFFEKEKQSWDPAEHLNLLIDQPVTRAEIPPKPAGMNRLYGVLESGGPYTMSAAMELIHRGSTFKNSAFGELGQAGDGGNAWFYMDYNPETGEIADARAYIYGFMGGVCDMRRKTGGSYGRISANDFYLNINGPCLFPQVPGSTMSYALLVQGRGNLAASPSGTVIPVNYVIDNSGKITDIPADPRASQNIYDSGKGRAWVN